MPYHIFNALGIDRVMHTVSLPPTCYNEAIIASLGRVHGKLSQNQLPQIIIENSAFFIIDILEITAHEIISHIHGYSTRYDIGEVINFLLEGVVERSISDTLNSFENGIIDLSDIQRTSQYFMQEQLIPAPPDFNCYCHFVN